MRKNAAPIIAIVLLLLPVLYVGSYLAMVVPAGIRYIEGGLVLRTVHYRWDSSHVERIFYPLEQIDRKVRPGAWEWMPWEANSRSGVSWKRMELDSP